MTNRPFLNFFEVSSLLALLLAVALLSAIVTVHFAIHGAEVQTPNLKGMTLAEARAQTSALGLNLVVDNRYYSAEMAAGHILSQLPTPGSVVRREWRVRVSESLGAQKVDVPDLVGNDERKAMLALRREGLNTGLVAHLPYAAAKPGAILAQDPPAHARGIARPTVDLLVAAAAVEASSNRIAMPDLSGLALREAQERLTQAGLTTPPSIFKRKPTDDAPAVRSGAVWAQQPSAGAPAEASAAITLTIAP